MAYLSFFVPSNRYGKNGKPTHMDGMNEIIRDNRTNKYVGARIEKENVRHIALYAIAAMRNQKFKPIDGKARVFVKFYEINRRRDVSNIYGGLKYVLDGLTRPRGGKFGAGVIYDDSPKYVEVIPSVEIDKERPGVLITIVRVDE